MVALWCTHLTATNHANAASDWIVNGRRAIVACALGNHSPKCLQVYVELLDLLLHYLDLLLV